ncbi:MAG: DegT/DnrJ/EryC1/StrS family aminotransferase [Sedimentisphaerales bacterium]
MSNVVSKYQTTFADWFKAKNAFAFWKGRVALYAILKALGIASGDEVILPGYTCVVDVNAIKYLGAKPVYVDIEPNTFNTNIEMLEAKITSKTRVIIAQHTYGYPCNMDAIMDIAAKRNIVVIEDCCLAFGSTWKGKVVGTFGKAAYFSSQWNKPFTTGLGGMAITNDNDFAEKINEICQTELIRPSFKETAMLAAQLAIYRLFVYPRTTVFAQTAFRYLTRKGIGIGSGSSYEFKPIKARDFFKAMSSVQASSGIRQLRKIAANIEHRRQMTQLYDELLAQKGWYGRQYDNKLMNPVLVRYPVRIREKNKALAEAAECGIELGSWFECPLHPIETSLAAYDYEVGMCPEAERASREVVNLALHPRTNKETAKKAVEFITVFTQVK